MNISDLLCTSIRHVIGTWFVPKGTGFWSAGNEHTCDIQGGSCLLFLERRRFSKMVIFHTRFPSFTCHLALYTLPPILHVYELSRNLVLYFLSLPAWLFCYSWDGM